MLELYQVAQEPKYYSDNFRDLRSITSTTLQNIALYGSNFPKVKTKVKKWIKSKRVKKMAKNNTLPPNLITDLHFYLESFGRQFYNRVEMLKLTDAISLYSEIHKKKARNK